MDFPHALDGGAVHGFKKYLREQGNLEELPVTNEMEVFRFGYVNGVLLMYRNKKGSRLRVNSQDVITCWDAYKNQHRGTPFPFKERAAGRGSRAAKDRRREALLKRDGKWCFYCGREMPPDDRTIEHVVSLVHGGSNRLENLVMAHSKCNELANNMMVVHKVNLRDRLRAECKP